MNISKKRKIRVAFLGLNGEFNERLNGISHRYTYELYKSMANAQNKYKNIQLNKINVPSNIFSPGLAFFANTIIKDFSRYDILHNINFKPCIPLHKGNAIFLTTALDFQPIIYPKLKKNFSINIKTWLWMHLVVEFGLRTALMSDYMITISTQTKEEAIKLGYNPKKIFVVNIGISQKFINTPIKKYPKKNFTVGYIGSFTPHKNIAMSIGAFRKIKDLDMCFEIWGHSLYWSDKLHEKAGNDKRIKFMGFAPEKRIVDIYDSFDVYVHPVLHGGFELEILEAQARGLPVVIYKNGKIPKEVRKYCFEAKNEEHMAQIIKDIKQNGYNEKIKKRATRYARSFTWERTSKETFEVYKYISSVNNLTLSP